MMKRCLVLVAICCFFVSATASASSAPSMPIKLAAYIQAEVDTKLYVNFIPVLASVNLPKQVRSIWLLTDNGSLELKNASFSPMAQGPADANVRLWLVGGQVELIEEGAFSVTALLIEEIAGGMHLIPINGSFKFNVDRLENYLDYRRVSWSTEWLPDRAIVTAHIHDLDDTYVSVDVRPSYGGEFHQQTLHILAPVIFSEPPVDDVLPPPRHDLIPGDTLQIDIMWPHQQEPGIMVLRPAVKLVNEEGDVYWVVGAHLTYTRHPSLDYAW